MNTSTQKEHLLTIRKLDHLGIETWRYEGNLINRGSHFIRIEAFFNRDDLPFHGLVFKRGDRFVETFFDNRWYNVFEIHAKSEDQVKCWYCNIGYPAEILSDTISYRDLALDLLIYPDGNQLVLDEDEFQALDLSNYEKEKSMEALLKLQDLFRTSMDRNLTKDEIISVLTEIR